MHAVPRLNILSSPVCLLHPQERLQQANVLSVSPLIHSLFQFDEFANWNASFLVHEFSPAADLFVIVLLYTGDVYDDNFLLVTNYLCEL